MDSKTRSVGSFHCVEIVVDNGIVGGECVGGAVKVIDLATADCQIVRATNRSHTGVCKWSDRVVERRRNPG